MKPKSSARHPPPDNVWMNTSTGVVMKACFSSFCYGTEQDYLLMMDYPMENPEAIIDEYIKFMTTIGALRWVESWDIVSNIGTYYENYYGNEMKCISVPFGTKFLRFKFRPNTERIYILFTGTLFRGLCCFRFVSIKYYLLRQEFPTEDPIGLFVKSWEVPDELLELTPDEIIRPHSDHHIYMHGLGLESNRYIKLVENNTTMYPNIYKLTQPLYKNFVK